MTTTNEMSFSTADKLYAVYTRHNLATDEQWTKNVTLNKSNLNSADASQLTNKHYKADTKQFSTRSPDRSTHVPHRNHDHY